MYLTTRGLVLRTTEYKETDRILTILTDHDGLLSVKARGVRSNRSKLKGACQLLTYAEFTISDARGFTAITEADAHTLEEIQAAKDAGPEALQALMLPVESVFESLPLLVAEPRVEQHLYNGCPTSRYPAADGRYRVRNAEGQFLGLANITGGVLKVEKLFVERN